ncbi:MAG TPA: hypothetical protein PKG49_08900 [Nitrosomonas mobilis]|nr:hypothetical protein [Nitrosomonas mobilis]
MSALGLKDEKYFRERCQQAGISLGVIEMTIPDKPKGSKQRYRLIERGRAVLTENKNSKRKSMNNTLKVRDDHAPICFEATSDEDVDKFNLCEGAEASWLTQSQTFGIKELRSRVEPWLTALFQSEHLSLLGGSGLTYAVHHLATGKPAAGMGEATLTSYKDEIEKAAKEASQKAGREAGNLEDQLRAANELLRGLEILGKSNDAKNLRTELTSALKAFAQSILESDAGIATADEDTREQAFNVLVTFLMSFVSRTGVRDRLNFFTTNYDRLIEVGAELAGLHLLDRFLGNLNI